MTDSKYGHEAILSKDVNSAETRVRPFDASIRSAGDMVAPPMDDGDLPPGNSPPLGRKTHEGQARFEHRRPPPSDGAVSHGHGDIASIQSKAQNAMAVLEAAANRSRSKFVARLAEYRDKLERAAESAAQGDHAESYIEETHFVAHRIAGAAKTFGFSELGDAASQTEAAVAAYKRQSGSAESQRVLRLRISHLVRLIEAICPEESEYLA